MTDFTYWLQGNTPGGNASAPPEGAPEGMSPETLNNNARNTMAAVGEALISYRKLIANDPADNEIDPTSIPTSVFAIDGSNTVAELEADQTFTGTNVFDGAGHANSTLKLTDDNGADLEFVHDSNTGIIGWDGTNQRFVFDSIVDFLKNIKQLWPTALVGAVKTVVTGTEGVSDDVSIQVRDSTEQEGFNFGTVLAGADFSTAFTPVVSGSTVAARALSYDHTAAEWSIGDNFTIDATDVTITADVGVTGAVDVTTSVDSPVYSIGADANISHGASGMVINDVTSGNLLYMGFDVAGGHLQAAFLGTKSVALGRGFNGKNGFIGSWQSNVYNMFYSSPNTQLWMNNSNLGNIDVTVSDERRKTVYERGDIPNALAILNSIDPIYFHENDPEDPGAIGLMQWGLSAQNVKAVFEGGAFGDPNGDADKDPMGLRKNAMIALLVSVCKKQDERITALENLV